MKTVPDPTHTRENLIGKLSDEMDPDNARQFVDDAIRLELEARNAEHDTEFYLLVNEAQAADLASGYVPTAVKAMCSTMLMNTFYLIVKVKTTEPLAEVHPEILMALESCVDEVDIIAITKRFIHPDGGMTSDEYEAGR